MITRKLFGFLQSFTGDVQIIQDAFANIHSSGNTLFTHIHGKHATHTQLDFVIRLNKVEGCSHGHEQQSVELKVALDLEMLHTQVFTRQEPAERRELHVRHILWLSHSYGNRVCRLLTFLSFLFLTIWTQRMTSANTKA